MAERRPAKWGAVDMDNGDVFEMRDFLLFLLFTGRNMKELGVKTFRHKKICWNDREKSITARGVFLIISVFRKSFRFLC